MLNFHTQLQTSSERLSQALARVEVLRGAPESDPLRRDALLFNLERAAWALIEMAAAWVFELRLGIPRKEAENFDLIQAHGWLELDLARKLKQLSEFRNLSSRETARIDWQYLGGDLNNELQLFRHWHEIALKFGQPS
jgi:uncharacterized protein YutE (UPF0331/DUF86 family)